MISCYYDKRREYVFKILTSNLYWIILFISLTQLYGMNSKETCSKRPTGAQKETKRRYEFLDLHEKEEIIRLLHSANNKFEEASNIITIANQFNVTPKSIERVKLNEEDIKIRLHELRSVSAKKRKIGPNISILEKCLYKWYKQKRACGELVTIPILAEKALIFNGIINEINNFKASEGWIQSFKDRLRIPKSAIKKDSVLIDEWGKKESDRISKKIKEANYEPYQIYNADESGLYWNSLPGENVNADVFRTIKERITLMVCSNADGSHKIPMFIIGKSKIPRGFKNVKHLPFTYVTQKNAWMNNVLFIQWYTEVFLSTVYMHQAEKNKSYKIVLILDNARCHLSREELNSIDENCRVEFLPVYASSFIQPMNQGVIHEIKKLYRKNFLRDLILKKNKKSIFEFIKQRNVISCCVYLANAWKRVSKKILCQAWSKLIPKIKVQIDEKIEQTFDDFLDILNRLPGFENSNYVEVSQWLMGDTYEPGWKILSAQEIIDSTVCISTESEDLEVDGIEEEEDSLEDKTIYNITDDDKHKAEEALKAFETFRRWLVKRSECEPYHVIALEELKIATNDIIARMNL